MHLLHRLQLKGFLVKEDCLFDLIELASVIAFSANLCSLNAMINLHNMLLLQLARQFGNDANMIYLDLQYLTIFLSLMLCD